MEGEHHSAGIKGLTVTTDMNLRMGTNGYVCSHEPIAVESPDMIVFVGYGGRMKFCKSMHN